jgi:uncharacterized protein
MPSHFAFIEYDDLEHLYAPAKLPVVQSARKHLTQFHVDYLNAATFFCLATASDMGVDVSPRGGDAGFVKIIDSNTLCFADWPGNNKIASIRNITRQDQVHLLFIFPGLDIFMRIDGRAGVTLDSAILDLLTEDDRRPKTGIVIMVDEVYFHCGKAVNRANLWKPESRVDRQSVPSPGVMMKELANIEDIPSEVIDQMYEHGMKHGLYSD